MCVCCCGSYFLTEFCGTTFVDNNTCRKALGFIVIDQSRVNRREDSVAKKRLSDGTIVF